MATLSRTTLQPGHQSLLDQLESPRQKAQGHHHRPCMRKLLVILSPTMVNKQTPW